MKLDYFENAGKITIVLWGFVLTFLVGFADYLLGTEISVAIFYLIPIALVTWYIGKPYGIIFAVLCSLVWLWNKNLSVEKYSSHAIPYWNALVRLGLFMVVVILMSKLKNLKRSLEAKIISKTTDLTTEVIERRKTELALEQKTIKLSELTKRLHTIREEENEIIAREIHDELGQSLTAMKIEIILISKKIDGDDALLAKLNLVTYMIDDTIKTIRKISTRLRPRLLDQLGFIPAVEWELKDFQGRTGIICDLFVEDENFDFSAVNSTALFRIFQESLTNVARHAKATNVEVTIGTGTGKMIKMVVKDNGIGITGDAMKKQKSLGILGMHERAQALDGSMEVIAPPEGGTEIIVTAPINQLEEVHD